MTIIWVYHDAQSRGMNAVLWLIVVLVGGIIGIIIYLIIRKDHPVGSYPQWQGFPYPRYYYQQYYYPPPHYPPHHYYQYQAPPGQYPYGQYPYGQYPSGQYPYGQYSPGPQPQVGKPLSKAQPLKKSVTRAGTKRKESPSRTKLKKVTKSGIKRKTQ